MLLLVVVVVVVVVVVAAVVVVGTNERAYLPTIYGSRYVYHCVIVDDTFYHTLCQMVVPTHSYHILFA